MKQIVYYIKNFRIGTYVYDYWNGGVHVHPKRFNTRQEAIFYFKQHKLSSDYYEIVEIEQTY